MRWYCCKWRGRDWRISEPQKRLASLPQTFCVFKGSPGHAARYRTVSPLGLHPNSAASGILWSSTLAFLTCCVLPGQKSPSTAIAHIAICCLLSTATISCRLLHATELQSTRSNSLRAGRARDCQLTLSDPDACGSWQQSYTALHAEIVAGKHCQIKSCNARYTFTAHRLVTGHDLLMHAQICIMTSL